MANFPLTEMAVKMFCPGNVVQLDDAGLPSVLVWIPSFKLSDVLNTTDDSTHPAFIVNGTEIPGFYYSKYENVVHNGMAYSLPAETPHGIINFDTAREYCEAKGYGWHMSTAAEWAAIALWCKKNGLLPRGNNNNGKDSVETEYKAIPSDSVKNIVATGTGPLTWSHDGTASGIWDMNGNVWEWQGGLRVVWGELQIFANNDAADPDNPQNSTSTCWKAINAADGTLVEPECDISSTGFVATGNTVRLDFVNDAWSFSTTITSAVDASRYCDFGVFTCDATIGNAAKMLLRALALLPDEGVTASAEYGYDRAFLNNGVAECCLFRGGAMDNGAAGGVFYLCGLYGRYTADKQLGFRAAYIPNI